MKRLLDWLDERTGLRRLAAAALDEPIPGGGRVAYVFGSALLVTLVLQAVTGVLLAFYYVPSIDHAHTTVAYVQKVVPLGWLVRGVHHYGASAAIIVALLHLSQTLIWAAYKDGREVLWLVGVVLLNLLLAFGFTGYLLPWDQRAYFGTGVAGGIAGSLPVVGEQAAQLLLGGSGVGQGTLSRFYAVHTLVLPATLAVLALVHLALFRFHGPAGPCTDTPPVETRPFWPGQFFRDAVAAALLAGLLAWWSWQWPAVLGPKANPAASYVPRPEWYFLWAFQLLKLLPAFVGAVLIPGLLMTALAAVPFLDRSACRRVRARLHVVGLYAMVMAFLVGITLRAYVDDSADPRLARQEADAKQFMAEPFVPDEIGKPPAVADAVLPLFKRNCADCHGAGGEGDNGPRLIGITSKPKRSLDDIVKLLAKPSAYGLSDDMPAFNDLSEEERREIAAFLATLR